MSTTKFSLSTQGLVPFLKSAVMLLALVSGIALSAPATATDAEFDHSDWNAVVAEFVNERGFVDYQGLSQNRSQFDQYIASIQATSPDSNPELFANKDHELAFWINAYNAQIFLGVLDWGTDIDSVWSGLISGRNFFLKRKILLGGKKMSLKGFEDKIIRARYGDPRIHAALNCASISCPRLPQTAFDPAQLDQQLDTAIREFVNSAPHVVVDDSGSAVVLSKIFDWFKKDFTEYEKRQGRGGSVIEYINQYRDTEAQIPATYAVSHSRYDKGLNRQ